MKSVISAPTAPHRFAGSPLATVNPRWNLVITYEGGREEDDDAENYTIKVNRTWAFVTTKNKCPRGKFTPSPKNCSPSRFVGFNVSLFTR